MKASHLHNLNSSDDSVPTVDVDVMVEDGVIDVTPRKMEASPASSSDVIDISIQSPAAPAPFQGEGAIPGTSGRGGALTTTTGSYSSVLATLTKDTFKQVVTDVEEKLKVANQTLSMLLDMQGFDSILEEMLRSITLKTGELLNADRTTIFLLDEEKDQLWSIVAKDENGKNLELRFPVAFGIAGEVASYRRVINIPYDFYDDPRSDFAKQKDLETGYRTYTMLALPLLGEAGNLVAVVQLINKLKPGVDAQAPLDEKIDLQGFTEQDEDVFREFAPSIRLILESSRSFYAAAQKQRAADALIKATESLSKSKLDLDETLKRVMEEAQNLMNADRSTLWLLDKERNDLWTKLPNPQGELEVKRVPVGIGYAGKVAETGEPLNIPFDLYKDPDSENSKKFDRTNGYRTCSLLCMPVRNADGELIGVTQLLNKKKQGDYPAYDPTRWPEAPECWRASFNRNDQEFMDVFNIQAGVALQNAQLFATVKQQEQMQRDILRSLSNGVISTDKDGHIIAANESARQLLGISLEEPIEGRPISDLLQIEKGDFAKWFTNALTAKDDKSRQQYYPDQTLKSLHSEEQHSVNLSINTIADAANSQKVSGALVVMDDISDEKRLKSTMYRYMTQELAEQLLENPDAAKMGGDRKEVSVLFSDIRSYTSLTESLTAEEVVEMLNEYFESMVDAVFTFKGTLDKYIGDAIMAVFGSPLPLQDHEWMALQTAVEMRHRLAAFNEKRVAKKKIPIQIGIGINSDVVISGNIGSSKRMEFTAIGDGVNLGSRLESASKQYGTDIIISENTYLPCADRLWARELDCIRVKGKLTPVSIYELVGLRTEEISDKKKKIIELYHKGREYYLSKKFTSAMTQFGLILEEYNSHDKASELHLKRCQYWLTNPPKDETWEDGVWTMTEK